MLCIDLESDVLSLVLSHSLPSLSQRAKMLIDYDVEPLNFL